MRFTTLSGGLCQAAKNCLPAVENTAGMILPVILRPWFLVRPGFETRYLLHGNRALYQLIYNLVISVFESHCAF